MRFVIQEHHARKLHYDLRLEMGGVLKSWAVPKQPSMNPKDKRLAIMVEDHPIDYIDFEGEIPPGYYGAGKVLIWDKGEYELIEGDDPLKELEKGKLVFRLNGKKLKGDFALIKMKGKENNWLLIKKKEDSPPKKKSS